MFHFIKQKLKNKGRLNACLFFGMVLFVAVCVSIPVILRSSWQRLLTEERRAYVEQNGEYPALIGRKGMLDAGKGVEECLQKIGQFEERWMSYLNTGVLERQTQLLLRGFQAATEISGQQVYAQLVYMKELTQHAVCVDGGWEDKNIQEGDIPCYISTAMMNREELYVGDRMTLSAVQGDKEKECSLVVAGIFKEKEEKDCYWKNIPDSYNAHLFLDKEGFDKILQSGMVEHLEYETDLMLRTEEIDSYHVTDFRFYLEEFKKKDAKFFENMSGRLAAYEKKAAMTAAVLFALVIPILLLTLIFISMVSGQLLDLEACEISTLTGRGAGTWQVVRLYFLQGSVLMMGAVILGGGLGILLGRLAQGADDFLSFSNGLGGEFILVWETIPAALAAGLVCVLFITIPVFWISKRSIIQQKRERVVVKVHPSWKKMAVAVLLFFLSVYLLRNYHGQLKQIQMALINGESADPVIFLDAFLFILGIALFSGILIHYLIRLFFYLFRKRLSAVSFASCLQISRTAGRQNALSLFLVLAVALSVFNQNLARTVNENQIMRLSYENGADVRMAEAWQIKIYKPNKESFFWQYDEPDYSRYGKLEENVVESQTRVLEYEKTEAEAKGKKIENICCYGIWTEEFGKTAELKEGLTKKHWYHALNALAREKDGFIISQNMAEKYKLSEGDDIRLSIYGPRGEIDGRISGKVCVVVEAFPGYCGYKYITNAEGEIDEVEQYLVVGNYSKLVSEYALTPYKVWMKRKPGVEMSALRQALLDAGIKAEELKSTEEMAAEQKKTPLVQITNGIFSIGLCITFLLCVAGFLIYWLNSIRERGLLFGVYRAMGMTLKELHRLLLREQFFGSFLSIFAGIGGGWLATFLFTGLLSGIYMPEKHNVDIQLCVSAVDMGRLLVLLFLMMAVCIVILFGQVRRMKVANVLKLGED